MAIDMNYRPDTYWPESFNQEQLLSRIKGKARQDMARGILKEKGFTGLTEYIARESLPDDERQAWGAMHPSFMGGEYLPSLEDDEVEIVRISLKSVTGDQISIRANKAGEKIEYRVVGEYPDMVYQMPFDSSNEPLSLLELVKLIDETEIEGDIYSGGLMEASWNCAYADDGDIDQTIRFATISSGYYPELKEHYDIVAKEWAEEHKNDSEDDYV